MIELLVKYIQDKGYIVDVLPNTLLIRKYVRDELISLAWGIPKCDLRPDMEEVLYFEATRKLEHIEGAIAIHDLQPHLPSEDQ